MDLHFVFAGASQDVEDTADGVVGLVGPLGDFDHDFVAVVRLADAFLGNVEIDADAVVVRDDESEVVREFQPPDELRLGAGDDLDDLAFGPTAGFAAEDIHPHGIPVQALAGSGSRDVDVVGVFFLVLRDEVGGSRGGEVHRADDVLRLRGGFVTSGFGLQELFPGHQGVECLLHLGGGDVLAGVLGQAGGYLLGVVDGRGVFVEYAQNRYFKFAQGVVFLFFPGAAAFSAAAFFTMSLFAAAFPAGVPPEEIPVFFLFLQGFPAFVFLSLHALECFTSARGASVLYGDLFDAALVSSPVERLGQEYVHHLQGLVQADKTCGDVQHIGIVVVAGQ